MKSLSRDKVILLPREDIESAIEQDFYYSGIKMGQVPQTWYLYFIQLYFYDRGLSNYRPTKPIDLPPSPQYIPYKCVRSAIGNLMTLNLPDDCHSVTNVSFYSCDAILIKYIDVAYNQAQLLSSMRLRKLA